MPCDRRSLAASLACALVVAAACHEPSPAGSQTSWSPSQAGERVREILAKGDPLVRASELAALFSHLAPEALPAVRDAFKDASVDRGDTELVLLAIWWARFDPAGAREWTTRDWTAAHLSVLTAVFRSWAANDPLAAWTEAQALLVPLQRELACDAVITGWRETGPDLDDFVASLPLGEMRQRAADTLARKRVRTLGAQRALESVAALGDPEFQALMRARIAGAAAWWEPEVAAAWAAPQISGAYRPSGLARRVATRWVRSDPEAAMAWLASLPEGGDREDGVLEAYRDWQTTRPGEAVAWIERQELAPWLEPAFSLYARGPLALRDPKAALALAGRFSDKDRRDATSTYIARGWLQRDREAADAWLKQSDLPADVVKRSYMLPSGKLREQPAAQAKAGTGIPDDAALE